ncbi:GNAT family N-acetyltransferase [Paenibacillus sp. GCM10012307]|uniref:GNAT family N-acetyltransferase n=1 Tax=Paenibacillus roseus TaxID=2798579 RepID=A0A934MTT0_9BACL|nr:GNAT family N-acetyltransferase [Paenibacillus roseus]MBJ6360372.1 GNAT family N-acetyltransferase [Paenibacillus roseus]
MERNLLPVEIQDVPTNHPELAPLITQLDRYLFELYPPEEVFIIDEEKAIKNEMQFIIAYIDNLAVGCGAIMRLDDKYAELKRFFVDPSVRNRGLARTLLSELERRARDKQFDYLRLETGAKQVEAVRFYIKHEFYEIPKFGEYVDCPSSLCYEKKL